MIRGLKNDHAMPMIDPRYRPTTSRFTMADSSSRLRHGLASISRGDMEKACTGRQGDHFRLGSGPLPAPKAVTAIIAKTGRLTGLSVGSAGAPAVMANPPLV